MRPLLVKNHYKMISENCTNKRRFCTYLHHKDFFHHYNMYMFRSFLVTSSENAFHGVVRFFALERNLSTFVVTAKREHLD